LILIHCHNLQELYIHSPYTDVHDEFLTSVSAHGGLIHVTMSVRSLKNEGATCLVRNSPKLITLDLYTMTADQMDFNVAKIFPSTKFANTRCM